ncbi:MAG: hypothetical protein WAK04_08425 [Xanthobacteraceae bacterium]
MTTSYLRDPDVQALALSIVGALKLIAEGPKTNYPFAMEIDAMLAELPEDMRADIIALVLAKVKRDVKSHSNKHPRH